MRLMTKTDVQSYEDFEKWKDVSINNGTKIEVYIEKIIKHEYESNKQMVIDVGTWFDTLSLKKVN